MDKKKIVGIAGIVVLLVIIIQLLFRGEEKTTGTEYIFDNSHDISLEEVKKYRKKFTFNNETADKGAEAVANPAVSDLFTDKPVNVYTLKYFKHLQNLFKKSKNMGEHLEQIKNMIFSNFPTKEAEKIFELYHQYLQCEMDLAQEYKNWGVPTETEAMIEVLHKTQEFRRERLGRELADALFGADVKSKEYAIRRASIVKEKELYGEEKERQLGYLNEDMWGEDAQAVEEYPRAYNRYQEKLQIYKKDLDEKETEDDRKALVKQFREEYFAPDIVQRLEEVDQVVAAEKETEAEYKNNEQTILNNPDYSEQEKKDLIRDLQDDSFGENAEAFRRRDAMQNELDRMVKEGKKK